MFAIVLLIFELLFCLNSQPIAFTQVNTIMNWWPETSIATSIGVPTYANTTYNYFSFQVWTCASGLGSIPGVYAKPLNIFGGNFLGTSDLQIRTELKERYQAAGAKVILGVFGQVEYPVQFAKNSTICAQKLAEDVKLYDFDGVEINYRDFYTFEQGTAETWLIDFTRKLRQLLPSHKIIHTVDSRLFRPSIYPKQGYAKINRDVGSMIDFYNVKFFDNPNSTYSTYDDLFIKATLSYANTSVREISQLGINLNKIVVGKSTVPGVSGAIADTVLMDWANKARQDMGWNAGFWLGDFVNDLNGSSILTALSQLRSNNNLTTTNSTTLNTTTNTNSTSNTTSNTTNNTSNSTTNSTTNTTSNTNTNTTNTTNTTINNNTNANTSTITNVSIPYPVYFVYVNSVSAWWGDEFVASIGVPGYGPTLPYNYIALSFWLSVGPADIALAWANAGTYFSWISSDTQTVQKKFRKAFNDAGKKIIVSAFGSTQFPTTTGLDPTVVANRLADFVLTNNLDGVDVDWQDNIAMEAGKGEDWIIKFHIQLRARLPNHIICHAPQAPYFKQEAYKNGAYMTIHNKIGSTIDFYNVQFYNQGDTKYDTYQQLFIQASGYFSGTSVQELINRGIPVKKIVVGKPSTAADVMNTGYVSPQNLGDFWARYKAEKGVEPQVMYWQLLSDKQGNIIKTFLSRALGTTSNQTTVNTTTNNTINTNTTNTTTNNTTTNTTNNTSTVSSPYILSMFYCGFGGDFCGQSNIDDVTAKSSFVILAFANTQVNGSIVVDSANFPITIVNGWKASGKKVLLSIGGQNGRWDVVFSGSQNTNNFINSIYSALIQYNLDGIDLDIEGYISPPRAVANMIIALKNKIGSKLLIVSPQCVTVYEGVSVPSADIGGQAWNYFVPLIILADSYIDFYQVQAYNNWYGGIPGGSAAYLKQVYLNWRNLPSTIPWSSLIPNFAGVKGQKLLMGLLASTNAGIGTYYAAPNAIKEFKSWLKANNFPLKGFMMWDSNWDRLNSYQVSNACLDPTQ